MLRLVGISTFLYYSKDNDIWKMNLSTLIEEKIYGTSSYNESNPIVSPDGQIIEEKRPHH